MAGTALFYKPDDYFDAGGGWRRQPGGGPILLNLIHEVNNLLSLVGDIVRVQAVTSNATRGFPVEDTAAMVFTFADGALGTFLLSDTTASARSWEQTSQENASYASYDDEDCYHIAGTTGSLSVPTMRVKTYPGTRSWWEPFDTSTETLERSDPLANQVTHFAAVIRGEAAADLQRPRRAQDTEGGRRGHRGRSQRAARRRHTLTRSCLPVRMWNHGTHRECPVCWPLPRGGRHQPSQRARASSAAAPSVEPRGDQLGASRERRPCGSCGDTSAQTGERHSASPTRSSSVANSSSGGAHARRCAELP